MKRYTDALAMTQASVAGQATDLDTGVRALVALLRASERVVLIGNGGSLAIAMHMATDFRTQAGLNAESLGDPVALTAGANDHGFERVFLPAVATGREAAPGRVGTLVAMSCSGESRNVVKATRVALTSGWRVVTMSGFHPTNTIRGVGVDIGFYVPSSDYGPVQVAHLTILHTACDELSLPVGVSRE